MAMQARLGLLALLAALLLGACGAPGQDRFTPANTAVDPYAAVRAQADEYYRQGLDYYRQGEFRRALDSFQRAKLHDPGPRPDIDAMIERTREAIAGGPVVPLPTGTPRATGQPATPGEMQLFVSRVYNYAITYPPGWRAEGARERVGATMLDLYLEEGDAGGSAVVFGFSPPAGASQEALIRESLTLRQKAGTPYKRLGVRQVDDAQAVVVTYSEQRADGVWLAVRQAVFLRGGTCWVVAVAAPGGDAQRYGPVLDQMLDGFRLAAARGG